MGVTNCRFCGTPETETLFEKPATYFWHGPTNAYLDTHLVPKIMDARIQVCSHCGFIGLPVDDTLRTMLDTYYTSPHSMPGTTHGQANAFASARTAEFISALTDLGADLAPDTVVEAGCQQGFLLNEFLRRGTRRAIGVEPGHVPVGTDDAGNPLDVRRGYLSADLVGLDDADLVYSLQVFEHIEDFNAFLQTIHGILRPGGKVMLAVPNERLAMENGNPGTFVFQHLNLFTPDLLSMVLAHNGFATEAIVEGRDRPLYILGRKDGAPGAPIAGDAQRVSQSRALVTRFTDLVDAGLKRVDDIAREAAGRRVALWGVNAATANLFSWRPDFAQRGWTLIDADPNKVGQTFGGVPGVVQGIDAANEVDDIIIVPYRAQQQIAAYIQKSVQTDARVHRLYAT